MKNLGLFRKRLGRFTIGMEFVQSTDISTLNEIFANMVIMKADFLYHLDAVEYVAYCTSFDMVEEGCMMPEYTAIIDENQFLGWSKL